MRNVLDNYISFFCYSGEMSRGALTNVVLMNKQITDKTFEGDTLKEIENRKVHFNAIFKKILVLVNVNYLIKIIQLLEQSFS